MNKSFAGIILMSLVGSANAALVNPEFDPSLTGWNIYGDASRVDPGGGDGYLMMTTANTGEAEHSGSATSSNTNVSALETTLFGSSSGQIGALSTGSAQQISAVHNTITVDVSGTLSWDWRMLTDETGFGALSPRDDDVAFLGLIATGASNFTHIVSLNAAALTWSTSPEPVYDFENASALQNDEIAGIADGTYTLVMGVFDANNTIENSAIQIDHLYLADGAAAPIPGTVTLLGLGLLGLMRKKK